MKELKPPLKMYILSFFASIVLTIVFIKNMLQDGLEIYIASELGKFAENLKDKDDNH